MDDDATIRGLFVIVVHYYHEYQNDQTYVDCQGTIFCYDWSVKIWYSDG